MYYFTFEFATVLMEDPKTGSLYTIDGDYIFYGYFSLRALNTDRDKFVDVLGDRAVSMAKKGVPSRAEISRAGVTLVNKDSPEVKHLLKELKAGLVR